MAASPLKKPPDLQLNQNYASHHSTGLSGDQTISKLPENQETYPKSPSGSLGHQNSVQFAVLTPHNIGTMNPGPRGPKTKAQRDHTAKMRKIGSCEACKKKKRRCQPSHKEVRSIPATSSRFSEPHDQGPPVLYSSIPLCEDEAPLNSCLTTEATACSQDQSFLEEGSSEHATDSRIAKRPNLTFPKIVRACVILQRTFERRKKKLVRVGKLPETLSYDQAPSHLETEPHFDLEMADISLSHPSYLSPETLPSYLDYTNTTDNLFYQEYDTNYANVASSTRPMFQHSENISSQGGGSASNQDQSLFNSVISLTPQNFPDRFSTDLGVAASRESPSILDTWEVCPPASQEQDFLNFQEQRLAEFPPVEDGGNDILPNGLNRFPVAQHGFEVGNGGLHSLVLDRACISWVASLSFLEELTKIIRNTITFLDKDEVIKFRMGLIKSEERLLNNTISRLHASVDECLNEYPVAKKVFRDLDAAKVFYHERINLLRLQPQLLENNPEIWKWMLLFEESTRQGREDRNAQRLASAAAALPENGNWGSRADAYFQQNSWQNILHDVEMWNTGAALEPMEPVEQNSCQKVLWSKLFRNKP